MIKQTLDNWRKLYYYENRCERKFERRKDMAQEDKLKALDAALAQIEKQFGKGSVMKLGDSGANMNIETVPTGSLSLDIALGLGGIPKGRVIEIYGPESSGKTTVALHMVAEVQKRGGIAGFIDAEHALDPVYAKNIGVDIDNLYISQPDNGEQALEITETMVRSGAVDIIIVDSVAALVPKAEIDGDMGDSHVGLQARLMSQALRKLTGIISKSNCTVVTVPPKKSFFTGIRSIVILWHFCRNPSRSWSRNRNPHSPVGMVTWRGESGSSRSSRAQSNSSWRLRSMPTPFSIWGKSS